MCSNGPMTSSTEARQERVPNNLRQLRQERLLTQDDLAALIGAKSHRCIGNLERGTRRGRWRTRKRIALALDVPESAIWPEPLT